MLMSGALPVLAGVRRCPFNNTSVRLGPRPRRLSCEMAPMLDDAPWPPWGLVDSLSSGSGARLSLSDPGALSESWSAVTEVTGVGWLKPADWIRVPVTTISDWPDWSAAPEIGRASCRERVCQYV